MGISSLQIARFRVSDLQCIKKVGRFLDLLNDDDCDSCDYNDEFDEDHADVDIHDETNSENEMEVDVNDRAHNNDIFMHCGKGRTVIPYFSCSSCDDENTSQSEQNKCIVIPNKKFLIGKDGHCWSLQPCGKKTTETTQEKDVIHLIQSTIGSAKMLLIH